MKNYLENRVSEVLDKLVREVLFNYLNREPLMEDYKKCAKISSIHQDWYGFQLAYEGKNLGRVIFSTFQNQHYIKFDPV